MKLSSAFLFTVLVSTTAAASTTVAADEDTIVTKVAILGGGITGITVAGVLEKGGVTDWAILEATDRLGGRVKTEFIGGHAVEHGATYVQGIQRNPIYDLLKKYKVRVHPINYNKLVFYENGVVTTDTPFSEFEKGFKCAEELGNALNEAFDAGMDPPDPIPTGRDLFNSCQWKNNSIVKDAIEFFDMEFEFGLAPEQFSGYAFPEYTYVNFRDSDYYGADQDGFQKLLENMIVDAFESENDPRVRRGHEMNEVTSSDNCGDHGLSDECVEIHLTNGKTVFAEYALSTISFGAIKNFHETWFPEGFPGEDVLDKFIMGFYHRTYLLFESAFWEETEYIISAKDNAPVIIYKPYDTGHPKRYFPGSKVLQANAGGDDAARFDRMTDDAIKAYHIDRLEDMYGPLPALVDVSVTRWATDPLQNGTWIQYAPDGTPADFETLFQPKGHLWFGGDASCRLYYGFMHGAHISGLRDGNRLLEALGEEFLPETRCEVAPSNQGKMPSSKSFKK